MNDPFGGIDPPSHSLIPPLYTQQSTDTRTCPDCGVTHGWVIEDSSTGKILEKLDLCRGCLLGFGPKGNLSGERLIREKQVTLADE